MTDQAIRTNAQLNEYIKARPNRACVEVIRMTSGNIQKCTDCPLDQCLYQKRKNGYNWRECTADGFQAGVEWAKYNLKSY